ncbi:MAG: MOSC domain-containing protein [Pseudorhodobacter sp.]|nr:MAG: MOSC domain-containing protein [Pseudorhodobacter sp.]
MTGRLAQICRHPIKGHGRETLASVRLLAGACLPWDRHWAVAHEAAQLAPGWNPCVNFARGAKAPALMAIESQLDEATATVTLRHPTQGEITFRPDDPADLPGLLDWLRPMNPANRAQPVRIVTAGRGMTDSDFPSVSILSTSSLADLSARMGLQLSPHRFRGNLWLEGAAPWEEFDWIGREIRIGDATLRIDERITRCNATKVNPITGTPDADTLSALETAFGHQDFGVYATVLGGGQVALGDEWSLT